MQDSAINFYVSFIEPQAHYVEIGINLQGFEGSFLDLKMPTWTPGSYLIREFSRHVESFTARGADDEVIKHEKTAKNTWRVFHDGRPVSIHYRVYGFEISVRTNFIDDSHAFLSPAGTFMYVDGYLHHPSTVHIDLPHYWKHISTSLPKNPGAPNIFYAENFDILFDSPIEIGNQDIWTFDAAGVTHEFAMVGGGNYDKKELSADIQKIVEEETSIWGSNPNDRYVFITHNYQNGGGGLEHLNSTVLGASRNAYRQRATYNNFLGLVAHEYFHLWNVKRLRPKVLGPFDYEAENYTSLLWIMEGFTAYYDNLIIRRCDFVDENEYLALLASDFNTVYNRPGYKIQSAGQASFDTWIKQYRPDENSSNTSISYYNKGAMLAMAIDLKVLAETKGEKRLDHILKAAYARFYLEDNRGFEEDEFKQLAEEVSGVDLSEIFEAVYQIEELDYNRYLQPVGYEIIDLNAERKSPSLGIRTAYHEGRMIIKGVDRDSSAWHAGLNVNDEVVGINGIRIDPTGAELENAIQHATYGEYVDILVARDGVIRTIPTVVGYSTKKSFSIRRRENADESEQRLGRLWLSL